MQLHKIHDLSNSYINLILRKGLSKATDEKYVKNYHPEFHNEPENLFYILNDPNGRYKKGCYYVLEDNGEYLCSAGWNEYLPDTALMLTRMYTDPRHRMNYYIAENILPMALENAKNYKHIWFTCNEHNKKIYDWFVRAEQGKRTGLFNDWPDIYRKFKPIGKKIIYYTEQYVAEYKE